MSRSKVRFLVHWQGIDNGNESGRADGVLTDEGEDNDNETDLLLQQRQERDERGLAKEGSGAFFETL